VLRGGLDLEDERLLGPSQVEPAPVQAQVLGRLGVDRQTRRRGAAPLRSATTTNCIRFWSRTLLTTPATRTTRPA
jgi:hypothetical protein